MPFGLLVFCSMTRERRREREITPGYLLLIGDSAFTLKILTDRTTWGNFVETLRAISFISVDNLVSDIFFGERAAHSVYRMFSFYFDIVIFVISHFGFEGGTFVLIVPGHCLSFPFQSLEFV